MKRCHFCFSCLLFFVVAIFFYSCKKDDQSRIQATWSSKDPLIVPYNLRLNQYKLENLVPNHSFESGKIFYKENNINSFDIDGWKQTGDHIEWVNTENKIFTKTEVYNGIRSIKITREKADETENPGEGIISDYIKVIPGNYELSLFLKLENIVPNRSRIGTKMYNAVNIKLLYFDKNKIEISGNEHNPFSGKKIDNAFKSLNLAHFRTIDEFGWGQVYGTSAYFPFFDGDIPDQARYVKIFIGLKGTGTMWIDQVDFKYTNKNLTQLERVKTYFDSSYNQLDLIYPIPKRVIKKDIVQIYQQEARQLPVIIIPTKTNKKINDLANKIRNKLYNAIALVEPDLNIQDIRITSNYENVKAHSLVISLGNTEIYAQNKNAQADSLLSLYAQSYIIESKANKSNLVFINGNGFDGLSNALNTFLQMLDEKELKYYAATIFDYPDVLERNTLIHSFSGSTDQLKAKMELFEFYKFSHPYFEIYQENDLFYFKADIGKVLRKSDAGIYLSANNANAKILAKYPKVNQLIIEETDSCSGVKYNSLFNNQGKEYQVLPKFSNLEKIHAHEIESAIYFNSLCNDLKLIWTGPATYSESIDDINFKQIVEFYGQNPSLLDNYLLADNLKTSEIKEYYTGKLRLKSIFEPYNLQVSEKTMSQQDKIILNTPELTEINTIRILTAANYYWNSANYDADKSLWIVLNKLYSKQNAINLLQFNDAYTGLIEICQKIKLNGSQHKTLRIAKNYHSELNKYWDLLLKNDLNKSMLNELFDLKEIADFEYQKILTENNK